MHASTLVDDWGWSITNPGGTIKWERTKNGKRLEARVSDAEARIIQRCIIARSLPTTVRTLQRWVRRIGERAGYPGISPLTLRHSRAIYLMDELDGKVHRVAALMGCSYEVLERHYAQIEAARLIPRNEPCPETRHVT